MYICVGFLHRTDAVKVKIKTINSMWEVWSLFILFIILCLVLDLKVLNKEDHVIETKEAAKWTTLWVGIGLLFSGVIWWLFKEGLVVNSTHLKPGTAFLDYLSGYLIELSLSIDNVFVIALIFAAFKIPKKYQHRVLFWGILGAIVFRALMIAFGITLIKRFDWMMYVFGAFLVYTAFTMLKNDRESNPKESWVYKQVARILPITDEIHGHDFIVKKGVKRYATPLLIALIIIELTDIVFALDSIPAILGVTQDEFIAFSSNILAILGLRSMFFLIVGLISKFRFINYSLAIILAFVGAKMLLMDYFHIPSWISLIIIAITLTGGIVASILIPPKPVDGSPT